MGAKVRVVNDVVKDRQHEVDSRVLTTPAAIMDSMVATEAELRTLWAQNDGFAVTGSRPSLKRIGIA
jgi:hypothetical protein